MMTMSGKILVRMAGAAFAVAVCLQEASAQDGEGNRQAAVRSWFADRYRFAGVEAGVGEADLDQLSRLWLEATDPGRGEEDRRGTLRDLLDEMVRVQGIPAWRYTSAALDALASGVAQIEGLRVPPSPVPGARSEQASGRVEVGGNGPVPLVMVGDLDYDASVYREFMDLHADEFTMYAISLPGTGGTAAPPLPERGPYSATPWLDHSERLILDLIEERGLDRPALVGVGGSGPLVARMAVAHPDRFRAVVLLHGLVFQPFPSPSDPSSAITASELKVWFDATLPNLFPAAPEEAVKQSYLAGAGAAARDSIRARQLALSAARTHPGVFGHYINEAGTIDLREVMAGLRVPTLAIPSIHDQASPVPGSELWAGQWFELALDHPGIPLAVVPFRSTRNYAPADSPEELGEAVSDFLAGRPVEGKDHDPSLAGYFASPRAVTTQVLGATEVTVEYYAPAVRGRRIWGGLVPYDAVWRAGANAATTVSISRDVVVEGRPLPAGQYTFFIIPREAAPWTLVFNRVPVQFGSFFRRPEHDALRIDVEPEEAGHQEHLRYRVVPIQPVEGRLEVRWGTTRLGLDLVAAEGTGLGRIAAVAPDRLRSMSWTGLAADSTGDGARGQAPDATALSYSRESTGDTVWFRIDLREAPDPTALGVNLVVDTDLDQGTGSPWWGAGTSFTFDRVATVWVMRARDTFWGTIGISGHVEALAADYTSMGAENLALAEDEEERTLYVGVAASELDDDGVMRLLVAVGSNTLWNDDIPDPVGVTLDLRR